MENQTQLNTSSVQPIPPVMSSMNWTKILLFIILGLVVIVISVLVGIQIGKAQRLDLNPTTTANKQSQIITPVTTQQAITDDNSNTTQAPTISQEESTYELTTYNSKDFEGFSYSISVPKNWEINEESYIPSAMGAVNPINNKIFIEISPTIETYNTPDFTEPTIKDAIEKSTKNQMLVINGQEMLYTEFEDSATYSVIGANNRYYYIQIWGISTDAKLIDLLREMAESFKLSSN